ncbi:hypothetical protein HK405_003276 [Cladochytrium tenue]|nr:hypothetical protein HK405_003276 [Cladochytrium tenue]
MAAPRSPSPPLPPLASSTPDADAAVAATTRTGADDAQPGRNLSDCSRRGNLGGAFSSEELPQEMKAVNLQSKIVELQTEKKALEARTSALEVKEKALEAEKADLKDILNRPKDRWAEINVDVRKALYASDMKKWIKETGTELKQIDSQLEVLRQEMKSLQEEKTSLRKQLIQYDNDLTRLLRVPSKPTTKKGTDPETGYIFVHGNTAYTRAALVQVESPAEGHYAVVPSRSESAPLAVRKDITPLPLVPVGPLSPISASGATTPRSPDDESTDSSRPSHSQGRSGPAASFREALLQRDHMCVVTGKYEELEASHILAAACSTCKRNQSQFKGIYHVSNGILLGVGLAKAFDKGKISFRYNGDKLECVAIAKPYCEYDGHIVQTCTLKRRDGSFPWNEDTKPRKKLVEYHLFCSVVANCSGAAEVDPPVEPDDDNDPSNAATVEKIKRVFRLGISNLDRASTGTLIAEDDDVAGLLSPLYDQGIARSLAAEHSCRA